MKKPAFTRAFIECDGVVYRWCGWYGCQLESSEWFSPNAGTTRWLSFGGLCDPIEVKIQTTKRNWFRVRCTWGVSSRGTLDEHAERIKKLQNAMRALF